jgi:hypothetical protein
MRLQLPKPCTPCPDPPISMRVLDLPPTPRGRLTPRRHDVRKGLWCHSQRDALLTIHAADSTDHHVSPHGHTLQFGRVFHQPLPRVFYCSSIMHFAWPNGSNQLNYDISHPLWRGVSFKASKDRFSTLLSAGLILHLSLSLLLKYWNENSMCTLKATLYLMPSVQSWWRQCTRSYLEAASTHCWRRRHSVTALGMYAMTLDALTTWRGFASAGGHKHSSELNTVWLESYTFRNLATVLLK